MEPWDDDLPSIPSTSSSLIFSHPVPLPACDHMPPCDCSTPSSLAEPTPVDSILSHAPHQRRALSSPPDLPEYLAPPYLPDHAEDDLLDISPCPPLQLHHAHSAPELPMFPYSDTSLLTSSAGPSDQLQETTADLLHYLLELQAESVDLISCNTSTPSFASGTFHDHGYGEKEMAYIKMALQPLHDLQRGGQSSQAATEQLDRDRRRRREELRGLSTSTPGARNSSISTEPQSVAARHRRGRIRDKLKELQQLVPGGESMDTACMLEEAAQYVAFLREEVEHLRQGTSRLPLLLTHGL